jgi:hypothetical protein
MNAAGLFLDAADRLLIDAKKLGPDFRGYHFVSKHGDGETVFLDQISETLKQLGYKKGSR